MGQRTCSVAGCDDSPRARGFCNIHYRRWLRHGDPLTVLIVRSSAEERFDASHEIGPVPEYAPQLGPCWIWTGFISPSGYGRMGLDYTVVQAHRFGYERFVGPIPDGLDLDHLCRVRACVNPAHLEPVTNAENARRRAEAKTPCVNGHEYTDENTQWVTVRVCKCCRDSQRAVWAKRNPRHMLQELQQ